MDLQGRKMPGERAALFGSIMAAWFLVLPPPAHAVQVGCFCTFLFVSTMFMIGIGMTMVFKRVISLKAGRLSWPRISLITLLEVALLIAILILLQTSYYLRVLVFLPFAFLLNYALANREDPARPEAGAQRVRITMAALSSVVLPIAVQVMAWVATVLSNMITFKEIRV